jgi:hypothetical protein
MIRPFSILFAVAGSLLLAGCESGGGGTGGDPGARPLPAGQSCQSLRAELNRMDAQGAQAKVERVTHGKGSAADKAVSDQYNSLLNSYLGARCHV